MRMTPLLPGLLLALLTAPAMADQPTKEVVPAREIHVVVMEPGGKVLPGATVSVLAVAEKATTDDRSLISAGRLRITDLDGRAIFSSLEAGDYYIRIEMEGALRQMIGPIPIGETCLRLPELRVIVLFSRSTYH
jgi:hypothetical protein